MNIECEQCIKRKTMYCPNSSKCYELEDKPQWQNRIMLLEENQLLKDSRENAIEYINNHTIEWVDEKFKENNIMVKFDEYSNPQALLEILKGDK